MESPFLTLKNSIESTKIKELLGICVFLKQFQAESEMESQDLQDLSSELAGQQDISLDDLTELKQAIEQKQKEVKSKMLMFTEQANIVQEMQMNCEEFNICLNNISRDRELAIQKLVTTHSLIIFSGFIHL